MIQIFKRKAWKRNPSYPGGWEPYPNAPKRHLQYVDTVDEARAICKEHNSARTSKGDAFLEFQGD